MRARQTGVAIVLAMATVALAALAATAILVTQSTWLRQNELTAQYVQAHHLVQAGVDWGRAVLGDDRVASNIDYLGEAWALRLQPVPIDNGTLAGHLEDQQAAFNLNNLVANGKVDVAQLEHLRNLLDVLGLPRTLADAVADWIDADDEPQPQGGAEDGYYLALDPPYLAANRPLISVGELTLVRGFDSEVLARLLPFVSALPRATPVNVNTASPEVLAAVVDGLTLDGARALVAQRGRNVFRTVADFSSRLPAGAAAVARDVALSSDYFMGTVRVTIGEAQARGTALLARENARWPTIVWRSYP